MNDAQRKNTAIASSVSIIEGVHDATTGRVVPGKWISVCGLQIYARPPPWLSIHIPFLMCLPITAYYANACGHQALAGSRDFKSVLDPSQCSYCKNRQNCKIAKKILLLFIRVNPVPKNPGIGIWQNPVPENSGIEFLIPLRPGGHYYYHHY